MGCPTCSTSSLGCHCPAAPSFLPPPYSIKISMLFLPWINHIPNIGHCDWCFCDVSGDDKLSSSLRCHFEHFILLLDWQGRVEPIYYKFGGWCLIMSYLLPFHLNLLIFSIFMLLEFWSLQLELQPDGHFMNLFFSSEKHKHIPLG